VLGDPASLDEESHNDPGTLEYPQYTRPRVFRGMAVPDILLSGNHQAIARWRREQSLARSSAAGWTEQTSSKEGVGHEESPDDTGGGSRP
jgi:tRNA (guanine37-N1)-methyltransferase